MSFNNPLGLLGLVSIPVILALHMFRERQNRYVVSSLKLWDFLEPEVHGNKARRIPFSWLLVLDLLAAIFLSLAWSQPGFLSDVDGSILAPCPPGNPLQLHGGCGIVSCLTWDPSGFQSFL